MRPFRAIVLTAASALSLLFLIGYARTIQQLRPVRPDPGLLILFEPATVVYYDYESATRGGLQFAPFFPPAFDLPLDSVQVLRVPNWIVAVLSAGVVVYTAALLFEGGGDAGRTRRSRQQPPRRAVDRFMNIEHPHCWPCPAPAAVPELGRYA